MLLIQLLLPAPYSSLIRLWLFAGGLSWVLLLLYLLLLSSCQDFTKKWVIRSKTIFPKWLAPALRGARPRSRVFRVESSNHAWHSLVLASRIRRPRSEGPWTFQLLCERYWHRWHRCAGSQAAFLLIVEDDIWQVRCDCLSKLACPTWWRSPSFTLIFRLVVVPEIWCLKSSLLGHCLV